MIRRAFILVTTVVALLCASAWAMDTAFSYQGRLSDAGTPANGDYDFQFLLYTAEIGGSQVGPIIYGDDVTVADGFFTIHLDFGPGVFDGTNLWLDVAVRDGAATGSYTPLAPRHTILPSPYSLYSATITWGDIDGMPPDFADGVDDDTTYTPGNQLDLTGDTFDVVEGPGSGLDADTVDGQDSADFATSAHLHSGAHITTGTVVAARIDDTLARDSEIMSIVLENDGSGSGLDADTLDLYTATDFAGQNHGHFTQGWSGSDPSRGFWIENSNSTDAATAIHGEATSVSGLVSGLKGETSSENGHGVFGAASSSTGTATGVWGETMSNTGYGVYGLARASSGGASGVYGKSFANSGVGVTGYHGDNGTGVYGYSSSGKGVSGEGSNVGGFDNAIGVYGESASPGGAGGLFVNTSIGYLIAGNDTDSVSDLEFKVTHDGNVYADGGYNCGVNFDCGLLGDDCNETEIEPCLADNMPADFAEMLPTGGEWEISAGDVLIIGVDGVLEPSTSAFDRTVAGVRSTRPSYLGNSRMAETEGYEPLAIVGIAPVKVVAENGPILPGDMLVTSSTPGHAMSGGEHPPQGTVIGKALEPLADDAGVIQMMVVMQ